MFVNKIIMNSKVIWKFVLPKKQIEIMPHLTIYMHFVWENAIKINVM